MTVNSLFRNFIVAACLLSLASYAWAWRKYHGVVAARNEATAYVVFPVLGMQIDLASRIEVIEPSPQPWPGEGRTLLLISSDTCVATQALLPRWKDLLRSIPLQEHDRVVLLSYDGVEVPKVLAAVAEDRGIHPAIYVTANTSRFLSGTGMNFTSGTYLLDQDLRLSMVMNSKQVIARPDILHELLTSQ